MKSPDCLPLIGLTTERADSERPSFAVLAAYVHAVASAGGAPVLIPCGLDETALRAILTRIDGLVLTGGGDIDPAAYGDPPSAGLQLVDPQRDQTELALARWAVNDGLPLLGICRGLQVLNVALGGSLIQDIQRDRPGSLPHAAADSADEVCHAVAIEAATALARVLESEGFQVNSSHHQAIRGLAPPLQVVARASDGVIEAVEMRDHLFAFGVQWHPERSLASPESHRLFQALTRAATQEYAGRHG